MFPFIVPPVLGAVLPAPGVNRPEEFRPGLMNILHSRGRAAVEKRSDPLTWEGFDSVDGTQECGADGCVAVGVPPRSDRIHYPAKVFRMEKLPKGVMTL